MPDPTAERAFQPRHLQLFRALFAAVAALMITFSPDHSAAVGLSVFSGFAVATSLVLLLSAWLVFASGQRALVLWLGALTLIAGIVATVPALSGTIGFFVIVISWAMITGLIEGITGLVTMRRSAKGSVRRADARDALTIGALGVVLALGMLAISPQYALPYYIEEADLSLTLTGISIGVGVFGGYAAIVAVYLAIAGFSPRREVIANEAIS